jgi:hypothetical protein
MRGGSAPILGLPGARQASALVEVQFQLRNHRGTD